MNDDKLDFLKDGVKEINNAKWLPIKKLDSHEPLENLKIGDFFWEYNKGVGYQRRAHTQAHVDYFWKGYGKRAFFTKEELLATYPDAEVCNTEI